MFTLQSSSGSRTSRSSPQLAPSDKMLLHTSPFDGWKGYRRHATIRFVAIDNPWDEASLRKLDSNTDQTSEDKQCTHVHIEALPTPSQTQQQSQCISIARDTVTHKPLSYILGKEAAPFTCLLCTLAYGGFTPVPDSSLYTNHNWALKWIGRPVNSDFCKVHLRTFQKLNHFPQTWRLGKKDELQRHMRRVEQCGSTICPQGWILPNEIDECLTALRSQCNAGKLFICKPTTSACGRGITLIQGSPTVSLPFQVNSSTSKNNSSQCNLCESNISNMLQPSATSTSDDKNLQQNFLMYKQHTMSALRQWAQRSLRFPRPLRWVVQRYVDDPYLIHGRKFDLRLYVVVTSYAPFRLYVYNEGLVRIATSPYYSDKNDLTKHNSNSLQSKQFLKKQQQQQKDKQQQQQQQMNRIETRVIADATCLTAHLTNFTVNKESEAFVKPIEQTSMTTSDKVCNHDHNNNSNNNSTTQSKVEASKWSFCELKEYLQCNGIDWNTTMQSVYKLLRSVFASITPHVRDELERVDDKLHTFQSHKLVPLINKQTVSSDNIHSTRAPCTFHGISPFFQIFGVDVLLRQPTHEQPTLLNPVLMQVNIMPSLSTHYSWLDQHIKGNFIADTLTLIGSTPLTLSMNTEACNNNNNNNDMASEGVRKNCMNGLQNDRTFQFLSQLTSVHEIEACMTAEEELLRSLPNFTRLCPSRHVTQHERQWLHSTIHTNAAKVVDVDNHSDNHNTLHYSVLDDVLYEL